MKSKSRKLILVCLAFALMIFLLRLFVDLMQSPSNNENTSATVKMTPADHLLALQKELSSGSVLDDSVFFGAENQFEKIPNTSPEYVKAKALIDEARAVRNRIIREMAPNLRRELADTYREFMSASHPSLNYIRTKYTKVKGGYALWAVHSYFGRYTFSIGDSGPNVGRWIELQRSELFKAQIVRVGVMDNEGYGGSCWFDVK